MMKTKIFSLMSVFLLTLCLLTPAFASDSTRTGEVTSGGAGTETSERNSSSGGVSLNDPDATGAFVDSEILGDNGLIATDVTTDSIIGKLESKGNDIVVILQTVGKYACIAGFIICCILVLIGIIGNKRLLTGAIIGLVISGVAYAGIVCGREIVNWIAAWAAS